MSEEKKSSYKIISYACAMVFCTAGLFLLRYFFDFYYDLNDDVLIKDILSGEYTGTPSGQCVQMLYPLSWILKCLYSINATIPWFGLMEIGLTWLCVVLMLARTQYILMKHINRRGTKIASITCMYVCVTTLAMGLELWELVMYQYTVISGTLATTAAYLVFTEEDFEVNENIVPIILVALSFNIRTEMFLLMCPFLGTVGICKWISDGFDKETCKKYISYVLVIICVLGASLLINCVAYRGDDWKEFNELFDARTTVYDFTGVPDYEENKQFYDQQLVYKTDYDRLVDYNYVLSDRVNAHLMVKLAEYAIEHNTREKSLPYAVFEVVRSIASWRTPAQRTAMIDRENPFYEEGVMLHVHYNMIIVALYILAVIAAIYAKDVKWAYMLPFLLIMRFVCWGYVSYKGRINARIAMPLYLIELVILVGILLVAWSESNYSHEKVRFRSAVLLVVAFIGCSAINVAYTPSAIESIRVKSELRDEYNSKAEALYNYTASNPREYYLLDVYSTVNFSEKIFVDETAGKGNTQPAGGWIALSPLDNYKQSFYTEEYRFITAEEREDVTAVDEIKSEQDETLFYVYNLRDVR